MKMSKWMVGSFVVAVATAVAGCATDVGPEGGAEGADEPSAAVDEAAIGQTSSAMTQLAPCASGADPNALGNLHAVGAFEEYLRKKSMIDFCTLGTLDRRDTIVDFSVPYFPIHKYEFIAAPNIYKAGGPQPPKDLVTCSLLRLEARLQKWDAATSSFVSIGAKVVKTGTWVGPVIGGHCTAPTHVFTRTNMIDSATPGGETNKYRVVMKVEQSGQAADAYVRGRNLGNGY